MSIPIPSFGLPSLWPSSLYESQVTEGLLWDPEEYEVALLLQKMWGFLFGFQGDNRAKIDENP